MARNFYQRPVGDGAAQATAKRALSTSTTSTSSGGFAVDAPTTYYRPACQLCRLSYTHRFVPSLGASHTRPKANITKSFRRNGISKLANTKAAKVVRAEKNHNVSNFKFNLFDHYPASEPLHDEMASRMQQWQLESELKMQRLFATGASFKLPDLPFDADIPDLSFDTDLPIGKKVNNLTKVLMGMDLE
ncbi:hypothetical protein QBC34DRAFT_374146 [Podospora aff. communis PSN243]|uniref:Uncharacterized protein n=1 Tax=Podospora aff. communis PSN243 TaxID=3040156 RepID=A0AAV9H4V7_9PEZI|nr:hypothetical protein QBC34DRAFT_374146 [Podospora aff. communis PSN243]